MKSATILMPPSTGLSGILLCIESHCMSVPKIVLILANGADPNEMPPFTRISSWSKMFIKVFLRGVDCFHTGKSFHLWHVYISQRISIHF